jgi:hypothetical protein
MTKQTIRSYKGIDEWLRPRGDHARECFDDAVNNLHKLFQRWDDLIPRERRIVWKHEL